jgi:hypothetical protein
MPMGMSWLSDRERRVVTATIVVAALAACAGRQSPPPAAPTAAAPAAIKLVRADDQQRVDVLVDGQPFTSYRWEPRLKKPVLFPLRSAAGALITRGWPLEPREGEPTDHPHHFGLWFSYGDVDGVDFWGHSEKNASPTKGLIVHRTIDETRDSGGDGQEAVLAVSCDWVMPDGHNALHEQTRFGFAGGAGRRVVDRVMTLTAGAAAVTFPDNKEGVFGLRLAHELEHPTAKNPGGTGHYRSSEGLEGEAVWGTRGRWLMSTAQSAGAPITIAMLDHPKNPGFPTYWHARPWGLMAANPLGQKALSKGKETLGFALPAGQSARFAYRVLILAGHATPQQIEAEYAAFAATK